MANSIFRLLMLTCVAAIATLTAYGQEYPTCESLMLKGNVHSMQATAYYGHFKDGVFQKANKYKEFNNSIPSSYFLFDELGRAVEETNYTIEDKVRQKTIYKYNEIGLLLYKMTWITNQGATKICKYAYSADNRLTEQREYTFYTLFSIDPQQKIESGEYSSKTYLYNEKGQPIEITNPYGNGGYIRYVYDGKGRLTEEHIASHKPISRVVYTYRSNGDSPIKKEVYNIDYNDKDSLKLQQVYEYNTQGLLTTKTEYPFKRYGIHRIWTYEYNEQGNVIAINVFHPKQNILHLYEKTTYTYVYDSHGNWTERFRYQGTQQDGSNAQFRSYDERIITYRE